MTGLDRRVEHWVVTHRVAQLDQPFVWLTRAGTHGLVWLVLGAAAAVALRRPQILLLVLAADVIADLASAGLKELVGRHRPQDSHALVAPPGGSAFPSGHAATSFACAAVLAAAMPRLAAPLFVLAAAIAFSRVYVGVHYPLDVLAGAALGIAVATALLLLARARRGSRPARPPD
jgi:undecaprenyl-diphosphatase